MSDEEGKKSRAMSFESQSVQTDREVMSTLSQKKIKTRFGPTFRLEKMEIHHGKKFFVSEVQHWRTIFPSTDTNDLYPASLQDWECPNRLVAEEQWKALNKEWDAAPPYAVLTIQWWVPIGYAWSFRECIFLKGDFPEKVT